MKFEVGDLICFWKGEQPCGVVVKVHRDKKTLKEFREMLLEGEPIDILMVSGKAKGVTFFIQDGGMYQKFKFKEKK